MSIPGAIGTRFALSAIKLTLRAECLHVYPQTSASDTHRPRTTGKEASRKNGMDYFAQSGFTGIGLGWIAIHVVGLFTAWMVRLQSGRRYEWFFQGGFFTALLAVAMTTVVGQLCCLEMWPLSAITLALMIVLAIVDLGNAEAAAMPLDR